VADIALDRRRVLLAVVVVAVLLVVAGRMFLRPGQASVPPPLRPAAAAPVQKPATREVFVDVVGAVRRPGLYRLRDGARVADAVARAGGVTPKAELELVNLAARVSDGEQVVVPRHGAGAVGAAPSGGGAAGPTGPVHLNSATLELLDSLPGVGPVTAQKILDYRERHGAFGALEELDAIPGIGPARLEQLRGVAVP
jgi:competence protein ComEA